jgi:hypothetical protein
MSIKYYLAGPMSGIPQSNIPLFDYVTRLLRLQGFDIISPAELDDPQVRARAMANIDTGLTWGDFLARDVKLIADQAQGIIFLPGWDNSRGARLEATVGLLQKNFKFMVWNTEHEYPIEVSPRGVANALHEAFTSHE